MFLLLILLSSPPPSHFPSSPPCPVSPLYLRKSIFLPGDLSSIGLQWSWAPSTFQIFHCSCLTFTVYVEIFDIALIFLSPYTEFLFVSFQLFLLCSSALAFCNLKIIHLRLWLCMCLVGYFIPFASPRPSWVYGFVSVINFESFRVFEDFKHCALFFSSWHSICLCSVCLLILSPRLLDIGLYCPFHCWNCQFSPSSGLLIQFLRLSTLTLAAKVTFHLCNYALCS